MAPSISAQGFPIAKDSLYSLLAGQQALVNENTKTTWYLFDDKQKLRVGPRTDKDRLLQTRRGRARPARKARSRRGGRSSACRRRRPSSSAGSARRAARASNAARPTRNFFYLIRFDPTNADPAKVVPEMTGADLKLSGTRADFDTQTGEPIVLMEFTDKGADKFAEITREIAARGRRLSSFSGGQKIVQTFAIVLDREIKSYPSIDWEKYPNGISGTNGAQITGIGDLQEAKDLALVLQTGALPVTFTTLETTAISATLGKDSLREAWRAAIVGLLVVALFLLIFYRVLGVVAVIGLGIYAAFLYAAILIFNVTLTLPGFAGIILTLGVAADANIVIFERVKEEYRAGKSVRAAIAAGYGKGFATIVDANVVTAITAMVLFLVATAGVKGFALMLLIGTLISLLTAVAATRAILGLLAGFNWFDNPKLMGAEGEPPAWIRRDFIGLRNRWFAISGVVLVISVGAIAINGLNLGIDFEGGTKVTFTTPQPVALEDVRAEASRARRGRRADRRPGHRGRRRQLPGVPDPERRRSRRPSRRSLTRALNEAFDAEIERADACPRASAARSPRTRSSRSWSRSSSSRSTSRSASSRSSRAR